MKLSHAKQAIILREKIVLYLLNTHHPVGSAKALFFESVGFTADRWEALALALREHASTHEVISVEPEPFGMVYVIEGPLQSPRGLTTRTVRVVWIVPRQEENPRLVTAYPIL